MTVPSGFVFVTYVVNLLGKPKLMASVFFEVLSRMPRVLSETDVADFRDRLCQAAERLFIPELPDIPV